jgi:hypothetical protein
MGIYILIQITMKKIMLLISFFCLISFIGSAQVKNPDLRQRLLFGIKAGLNYSNVYDTKGEDFKADPKFGFVGGMFLSIPIGKLLGFEPEMLFSQRGFQAKGTLQGNPYGLTRTTSYMDFPLLIQLKPASFLTLVAGPQFSFLVRQRDVFDNGLTREEQDQVFNNHNIRKNILCFLGGFDINVNHVVIGTRVGWDVTDNNGDGTSSDPRYKNIWYQMTLGLRF